MERFFKLLYYYLLGILILFVLYMVTVLALSPKKDVHMRGFLPCTEELVMNVGNCERGQMLCPLKWLWKDTTCNTYVILDGFGAWVKGEQSTPWASYLFEPETELPNENDEPYDGDVAADMKDLDLQRQFIEQKQQELEAAKRRELNMDETVIIPESGEEDTTDVVIEEQSVEEYVNPDGEDAIADEAFMEVFETQKDDVKENTLQNEEGKKADE